MPDDMTKEAPRTRPDPALKVLTRPIIAVLCAFTLCSMAVLNAAGVIPPDALPWWFIGPAGGYVGFWSWERQREKSKEGPAE